MREQLHYTIEVRDREGKLVRRLRRKAHSYLKAYQQLLYTHYASVLLNIRDIINTLRAVVRNASDLISAGVVTDDDNGVVIGTGSTAVTISDYKLETQIAEGVGAGQMEHQAGTKTEPTVAGSSISCTLKRIFINNSGNTITVTESGIYCYGGGTTWDFCIVRDVLPAGVAVPDGGAITVTYTLTVTV
jgi:hypothetical protein